MLCTPHGDCQQFGIQVFEDCCSLMQVGTSEDTANQLAPQAELMPRAFEKCTALRHLDLGQSEHNTTDRTRCLPECYFLDAGITSLSLPPNFNWIESAACERCLQLQQVNLSSTEVTEIMGSAFAHCKHLQSLRLPHKLRIIEQEAFLKCTSLTEVSVPPTAVYCKTCFRWLHAAQSISKSWKMQDLERNIFQGKCVSQV